MTATATRTAPATAELAIEARDEFGWTLVRPASNRSNAKRDARKLADRSGVDHRAVRYFTAEDGGSAVEVLGAFAGQAEDTAAELALVGDATDTGYVTVLERTTLVGEMADEMTGCASWKLPTTGRPGGPAVYAARTERGFTMQSRPAGDADAEWTELRKWANRYMGVRNGRSAAKKDTSYELRLLARDGQTVVWTSTDEA